MTESIIAGQAYSAILSMRYRWRWYKTILPEEKEEAMKIVETARQIKHSKFMTGENNPSKRPEVQTKISAAWTPEKRAEKSKVMMGEDNFNFGKTYPQRSENMNGENNPNWRGGKSFELYGMEFNIELRSQIRERDNYTCQECHQTEEQLGRTLDVHHIDYDKQNNNP